jgi:SAM-dependent methyltransferase
MSALSPAEAYDQHVGRYGAQLARALIGVAGVRPGQRALDVGCGPGSLTSALADVLDAGNVAAVDPSAPFVEACRARVPGADVRVGRAERLPFAAGSFDLVLAQLVVQLMEDRDAGMREMVRVALPGGTVAACVWDSRGMPLLRAFWDAALEAAPERAGAIDDGRRVGYASPGELGELFHDAGVGDVSTGELSVAADYESFDDLWRPFASGVGHSGTCCASLDGAGQAALAADLHRRLGSPEGRFRLTARAWWARGTAGSS